MDIPTPIREKLLNCEREAHTILNDAANLMTDFNTSEVGFRVSSTAPSPLMTWAEQAQSLAFVVRYEHLPVLNSFVAGHQPQTGLYYLNEIDQIRAALNEYRTIFFNKKDGIYYGAITNLYQKAFIHGDPKATMKIEAFTSSGEDRTVDYLTHLRSRKKAIRAAIQQSDFDYIYNGVLQHTNDKFAFQMVKDYADGSLSYLLLKNVLIAQGLREFLVEHYRVINTMNFPKMGAL